MYIKINQTLGVGLLALLLTGCGTTKSQRATEQLLMSDAVDRAVASIDFHPLTGQRVFLDTKYLKSVKSADFVNADYIISSLRQQMVGAGCLLEETSETAEYIAEARVGALGTDSHDVTYGIPASRSLSNAAALVPNAPSIPMVPEISLARKNDEVAAAKIAVFAYHRESRRPVWQSGVAEARSTAKDTWLFGAGPFQSGTIHDGTQFAGEELGIPLLYDPDSARPDPLAMYNREVHYVKPSKRKPTPQPEQQPAEVEQAAHEEQVETPPAEPPAADPPAEPPAAAPPAAEADAPPANPEPPAEPPAGDQPAEGTGK